MKRALVLGGGGITGIAWELGMLAGLREQGIALGDADLVVGTSAGSIVGSQLRGGRDLEELYAGQLAAPDPSVGGRLGPSVLLRLLWLSAVTRDDTQFLQRLGRWARRAKTGSAEQRVELIARALPTDWPERELAVTAIDTTTGERLRLDRSSGVPFVRAVAASCAVPLVWPPVEVGGRLLMDGGMRSPTNADLAAGYDRVVVLAPLARPLRRSGHLKSLLTRLGPGAIAVSPDREARSKMGRDLLDVAYRRSSAEAGRAQSRSAAEAVAKLWGSS